MRIKLTMGEFAIIDDQDYPIIAAYKWSLHKNGCFYAVSRQKKHMLMHRLILGITDPDILVDHIDGNGLNNSRNNLRIATRSQNAINAGKQKGDYSSKYRGVTFDKGTKKWRAYVQIDGKFVSGGRFSSEHDAVLSRDKLALKLHGEFARVNQIQ